MAATPKFERFLKIFLASWIDEAKLAQRVVREATNKSETVLKKVDEQLALIDEEIEKVKKHQKTVKEWQEEVFIIIFKITKVCLN